MFKYLENRLGIFSLWRSSLTEKRPPQGIGYLRTLGFAAVTVMVLQLLSGLALALHYVPSTDLAYDSIRALQEHIPYGTFTRSLHHFGASAMVILVAVHMMRVYFTGAYKRPREFTWLTGVVLFSIVLGFGFTGYLLPWDQKAYFATKVGTEIAVDTPVIGAQVRELLRGGVDVGQPTLTRFYIIHVVFLPLALLGVLGVHFYLIQRHGVSAPGRIVGDEGEPGPPYHPHHTFKEALVGVLVAGILFVLAYNQPAPLEALAEPADTGYTPRPDWYFLGLFYLLSVFEERREIGTFWIPTIVLVGAVLLPFIDLGRERHWRKRWFMTSVGVAAGLIVGYLTLAGYLYDSRAATDEQEGTEQVEPAVDENTAPASAIPFPLGYTNFERRGYLLTRRLECASCHPYTVDSVTYGGETDRERNLRAPFLNELTADYIDGVAAVLEEPPSEDMPAYTNISAEDRLAIGAYIVRLVRDSEDK